VPLFHGHADRHGIVATIAENRGYITTAERDRILGLMSRIGLALIPSSRRRPLVGQSITLTRDGLRCNAETNCFFVNDLTRDELEASRRSKHICAEYPRWGLG